MAVTAIPWIIGGLQLGGTIMQMRGAAAQGAAAQAAGNYNAQVSEQNAVLVRDKAAADEKTYRKGGRRQMGAIASAYAASGITMEGSAMDVVYDSALTIEMDALNILHGGEIQAAALEHEADLQRMYGAAGMQAGQTGAAAAALGGAATILQTAYPQAPRTS